ncbi:hypothetical protein E0Z10_g8889 [Xylaria hypoxylon]|uniref:DUF7779 domain-containing protein n=1 Tax=Xylaria hypoxylon TaxID=37992 RepID=A0A4Z0YML5_9PEZI|nr:hypothetical protein E0Z10_g8889 [Xylaria hypoxylon]
MRGQVALLRLQWSSFLVKFRRTAKELKVAIADFEKEAQFAQVQEDSKRHTEILNMLQGATPKTGLLTNIDIARNEKFTGRESTLALLHSFLSPENSEGGAARVSSCLIHAIGVITCLTREMRHTTASIQESFPGVVAKLNIVKDSRSQPSKLIELGLEWFQITEQPWLLIFDNVEDVATIRDFWLASTHGAVIATSQKAAVAHLTKHSILLDSMLPEEGGVLIQNYLNRGGSEKESAEYLAESLGSMPLAIVHFAGYIARSNCPVEQISQSLSQRLRASTIWKIGSNISLETRAYQYTLNTVWDLSFHRLTDDAMTLLEYIAFLDPDHIPVDLFTGESNALYEASDGWKYWDIVRFNEAVGVLSERHLVDRSSQEGSDALRTHRALKMRILQRLDADLTKRANRFSTVIAIIRKAVPKANIVKRSDASQFERYAKYLPQISSARTVFVRSEPAIDGSASFASLLHDFAFYTFTVHTNSVALAMAETGESICEEFEDDSDAKLLLPILLNTISQIIHYRGIHGRERGLVMMRRVVKLREAELRDIPPEDWTELQSVTFARAQADLAWELCELNMLDEAALLIATAARIYRSIGNTIRLAQVSVNQLMFFSTHQDKDKTLEQGRSALSTLHEALGKENPLSVVMSNQVALAYFTVGEVGSALETMEYVSNLREILNGNRQTEDWREEDIIRTKFRLSIVLRAQNRHVEAAEIRQDIDAYLSERRGPGTQKGYTDGDDMQILDYSITLCHGRTAGIWGTEDRW